MGSQRPQASPSETRPASEPRASAPVLCFECPPSPSPAPFALLSGSLKSPNSFFPHFFLAYPLGAFIPLPFSRGTRILLRRGGRVGVFWAAPRVSRATVPPQPPFTNALTFSPSVLLHALQVACGLRSEDSAPSPPPRAIFLCSIALSVLATRHS